MATPSIAGFRRFPWRASQTTALGQEEANRPAIELPEQREINEKNSPLLWNL